MNINLIVSNSLIRGFQYGIYTTRPINAVIVNSTITNNSSNGIYVNNSDSVFNLYNSIIAKNTSSDVNKVSGTVNAYNTLSLYTDWSNKSNVTNYTYVTLQGFHRDYPDDEFYFIMGGDSIEYFHNWVKPEVIASQAVLLAGRRKNVDEQVIKDLISDYAKRFNADVRLVGSPETDISSTKLREMLKNLPYGMFSDYEAIKNSVEYKELLSEILKFMDEKSLAYIYENRVYDKI